MILGAAWYGFRRQTPENYFGMAAALGLRHVEIPLYSQIVYDESYRYVSRRDLADMRALAEEAGVRMVSSVSQFELAGGFDIRGNDIDPGVTAFGLAGARRAIEVGAQLGLSVMRITEPNIFPERLPAARDYMTAYGAALRPLGEYAAERGLRIAAENYGLTSEQACWMLDAAGHPAVGALYDPCNFYRLGEDPLQALRRIGQRVYYCHLKDAVRGDPRDPALLFKRSRWAPSVAVGAGEIDWAPILAELASFYSGYLCIEYEIADDVMRGMRASLEYLQRLAAEQGLPLALQDERV